MLGVGHLGIITTAKSACLAGISPEYGEDPQLATKADIIVKIRRVAIEPSRLDVAI
jgi:hypothetical protein